MWKTITLFVCISYTSYVQATYNTGIKTKVYEHQQPTHVYHNHHHHQSYTPTHEYYNQNSGDNNDKDYQSSITHHYAHTGNSHQQQRQREGNYYQPEHQTPQQSQTQPIYERKGNSQQIQIAENWENSENSITEYYTGCPEGHTGQLPYAYDCRRFLNCWHGRGHIQTCSVGTVFNAETLECDRPDKVKCEAALGMLQQQSVRKSSPTSHGNLRQANYKAGRYTDITEDSVEVLCPVGAVGLQPHPSDCTRFVNCANGNMYIQQCAPGTAFSISTKLCDFKNKVDCSGREVQEEAGAPRQAENEISCPADAAGLYPHPYDCSKFLQCSNGETYIQDCSHGTAFDSVRLLCDYKDKVKCCSSCIATDSTSVSTETMYTHVAEPPPSSSTSRTSVEDLPHTADILCLGGITGLFPYPFDYTKFINCKNGNTAIQNCVPGTAFSISKGYCENLDEINKSDHVMYIVSQVSYEYSQTLITCPPGTEGIHLYPFNAELFVKCIKSQMKVAPCNNANVFSVTRRSCLPQSQVLKHERVRLLSELQPTNNYRVVDEHYSMKNMVYCPGGFTGTYAHPFDSTKYLKCVRGRLMSESCASGQAFSLSRKVCGLKEEMNTDDYVPHAKITYGQNWKVTDMEITHGSIDGLTYLMCPPGLDGYFLHPFDCTKYIECSQGVTTLDNCLNGAVFSISRKECIPRDKVEAYDRVEYMTTTANEFSNESAGQHHLDLGVSCNPGTFGIYPHPHDYHKYVRCANGRISVESCRHGQVFSVTRNICLEENEVNNNDRSSYSRGFTGTQNYNNGPVTTTLNTVYKPPPYNPSNMPLAPLAPLPTAVIRPPSVVMRPPLATSPLNTPTESNVNCPPESNGRYPHPFDCTKFLICSNGQTFIQDCGPGTAWSKEMEVCEFKEKIYCNQNTATSTSALNSETSKQYDTSLGNTQWSHVGATQTQPTTKNTETRWSNMNISRPQASAYNQTTNRNNHAHPIKPDFTSVWSGTATHVDQQNPTHTVIYEEGSFVPNSNYNPPMYNTPLAPLKPTTTTTTSTIVYAQPVGSQEDSNELFSNTPKNPTNSINPQYFPPSNRKNHTRHLETWTAISNVEIPKRHQGQNNIHMNTHIQTPIISHLIPPYESPKPSPEYHPRPITQLVPPYSNENNGQRPLSESEFKITTINFDQLPGQKTYNLNDFDQLPSSSTKHDIYDASNLYGSLQPPLGDSELSTTARSYIHPSEQTTQVPPPPETTTTVYHILGYPQLSNATIQTFPRQPHYSSSYAEVYHSRNATKGGGKIPQHNEAKPHQGDLLNYGNTNIKTTLPQYYGHSPSPPAPLYSNNEREEDNPDTDDQEATMKAALKLLLKPYLDSEDENHDKVAEKAQSHIMNLVINPNQDTTTTTTTHRSLLNKNTLVPSTTPHQEDVELILAGEQHNLVGLATTQMGGNHESSTTYNHYQTPSPSHHSSFRHTHNHNSNWHKDYHHDTHHSKTHHSREFHKKHPNLPNPFDDPPVTSYNSDPADRTGRVRDFDLRSGGSCPFDCGSGKCIEEHEVCNGVNNCGNRKDEQECEHLGYELRLTAGQTTNMGRVEVKILGKWGYVCDDKFGLRDADVVCRELGFKMGAMEVRGNSYYAPSDVNVNFAMDEVECKGNETSLRECDFKGWGINNCGPDEVVGVVCKVPKLKCPDNYWLCSTSKECIPTAFLCDVTPDCEDGSDESEQVCNAPIKYRLEGGRSTTEGRLEVLYRGEWGTVCDDDFGLKEAQVLCNSLGLYGKPEIVKNIYGPGSGPIWLDQLTCLGNETKLDDCNHWSWGENNCNHTEDVGIKCTAGPKPNPSKANKRPTDDGQILYQDIESTLQVEQSELDDLGLYQGLWQRSSKAVHSTKKCGHFKPNLPDEYEHPEERVVNGTIAKRGRHPWQATIRTRGRGGISSHWCGAVIISRKLILTAAHCLAGYPKGSYFVRMGDHYANIAESSEVDSNIENWYIHEKFRDQKHMNNDIALILLKNTIRFTDYVQPICLPEKGAALQTNRLCTISGWGSIKSGTSTPSNILRSAHVPILADDVCSKKNVYANAMTEGMFCAGFLDESADACDGDSGGPLVCSDEDGETLYGIISWGQHCGYANHPGVYVRVEKYIDWIYDKINLMMQQGKL